MFTIVATVVFFLLFGIWDRKSFLNTIIKLSFLGLAIWGLVNSLHQLGYIVKTML